MIHINGIKIGYREAARAKTGGTDKMGLKGLLTQKTAKLLQIPPSDVSELMILRESVDARKKPDIYYSYVVAARVKQEDAVFRRALHGKKRGGRNGNGGVQISQQEVPQYCFRAIGTKRQEHPVVIVGMGPAGLFCGYFLALHGYRPVILERGKAVEERQADVERFWETGTLLSDSNVQFGEGGAGAFSDGKLNTLVKDKEGRNRAVLQVLVDCGADESILYEAKPHIGTDVLCNVVKRMRKTILQNGGCVRFESQVTDIATTGGRVCGVTVNHAEYLPCEQVVLAVGHSARDTFSMLYDKEVPMEAKAFAVGLRVEHLQSRINVSQYGLEEPGVLGAAPYKVTAGADQDRGVYSFCMCPGGYVVNASSQEGHLAVNGMSYSGRDGKNANSAVIVSVTPKDFGGTHPLAGVEFQRMLEKRAYELAQGKIPMQRYGVFKACVEQEKEQAQLDMTLDETTGMPSGEAETCEVMPEHKGLSAWADVSRILPRECNLAFLRGMDVFGRQIRGFDRADTLLSGVESRTSSPVRINRDETLQSKIRGLYPCGEGAGYAGGITSAAMDGLKIAEAIAGEFMPYDMPDKETLSDPEGNKNAV